MLITVLVLALLGLWTPVAVALVIAYHVGRTRLNEDSALAPLDRWQPRLQCSVCGAHYFSEAEPDAHQARSRGLDPT